MNIQEILIDWESGLSHGQILEKHQITREQEFAITLNSEGLTEKEIESRIINLKPGMKAVEIKAVMQGGNDER